MATLTRMMGDLELAEDAVQAQLYIARAELQRRLGRPDEAVAAYRSALRLDLPAGERTFIDRRIRAILADCDFLPASLNDPAGE